MNIEDLIPQVVYKYRDYNCDKHRRIITHQEIYFARPSEFPDPYDCRFRIDKEYIKDEMNRRIYYSKHLGIENLYHPRINHLIKENIITDQLIENQEKAAQTIINRLYGIFSVSRTYQNDHLWKIFGGNHKGFCVGLDFQGVLPLNEGTKGKVEYKKIEQLPKSKVLNFDNDEEMIRYVFDTVLTLPIDFIDEQEYRMQKTFFDESKRTIKLEKKHIKIIILGHRMSEAKRNEIIDLIGRHLPETKIKRRKYISGKISELDIDKSSHNNLKNEDS